MDTCPPLQGRIIVVTRPRGQADGLAASISALGGQPFLFPLLEINPLPDPAPLVEAVSALPDEAILVFVSPNAAHYALPYLQGYLKNTPSSRLFAVGKGSAQVLNAALRETGQTCQAPLAGSGSESLLALPELSKEAVKGKTVVIFRGNGGRELLGETLKERGATVRYIACYCRGVAAENGAGEGVAKEAFLQKFFAGKFDAITLSSSESLGYLLDMGDTPDFLTRLYATPLFVSHPRIARKAQECGFTRVIDAPTNESLLSALCAYNWSNHE